MEGTSSQNTEVTYIQEFLGTDAKLQILEDKEKSQSEGHISDTKAWNALKVIKHVSTPGSDGLTTEFYSFSSFFFSGLKLRICWLIPLCIPLK